MMRIVLAGLMVAALIGSMGSNAPGPAHAATVTVDVEDNFYAPAAITVNVGDTVQWNFVGALPHTVSANDASFDSGAPQTSGTFSFTFTNAGSYSYICGVHGQSMSGTVNVQEPATATPRPPSATPDPDDTPDGETATPVPSTSTPASGNTPPVEPTAQATQPAGTPVAATATPGGGAGGLPTTGTGGENGSLLPPMVVAAAAALILTGGGALAAVRMRRR